MKFKLYIGVLSLAISLTSCLKSENDFAGQREDNGTIVTAISEQQYLTGDKNNLQFGYGIYAGFSFTTPATESVRFLTLHISQPRENKINGNLSVKIAMTAPATAGYTAIPANAITIPSEILVPAQDVTVIDVPVRFTVNKAALNPALDYGATFTISSVSQGVASKLEKSIEVHIINSRFSARYQDNLTVVDANDALEIDNNRKPVIIEEVSPTQIDVFDFYAGSYGVLVANKATGATTSLFTPRYQLDASGKLTAVLNRTSGANLNATIDPSSGYTYTANDNRTFIAKYTVTLTVGGVARQFTINEKLDWVFPQAF